MHVGENGEQLEKTTAAADEECCPAEEHDTEIVKTGSVAISSAEMWTGRVVRLPVRPI